MKFTGFRNIVKDKVNVFSICILDHLVYSEKPFTPHSSKINLTNLYIATKIDADGLEIRDFFGKESSFKTFADLQIDPNWYFSPHPSNLGNKPGYKHN
jgi:hypothetical protein